MFSSRSTAGKEPALLSSLSFILDDFTGSSHSRSHDLSYTAVGAAKGCGTGRYRSLRSLAGRSRRGASDNFAAIGVDLEAGKGAHRYGH